jgi:hypothetical protein
MDRVCLIAQSSSSVPISVAKRRKNDKLGFEKNRPAFGGFAAGER